MKTISRVIGVMLPVIMALMLVAPGSAQAWWAGGYHGGGYYGGGWRGGFYGPGIVIAPPIYAPYYAPAPTYAPAPAYPAQDSYYPPLNSTPAPARVARSCQAVGYVCPLEATVPPGGACYCPGNNGQRVYGRASS